MKRIFMKRTAGKFLAISALAVALSAGAAQGAAASQGTGASGPRPSGPCPAGAARIACVDLTHQVMWVQSHGKVIWGPVHIRSGALNTPTSDGLWRIYRRALDHHSSINGEWMPYSQFIFRGEAFHGTTKPLNSHGSLGCVTMTVSDAASLWQVTRIGDPVSIYGHRIR